MSESKLDNGAGEAAEGADIARAAAEAKIAELDILKQSLEEAKKQSADYYDQLLRLKAEFENFRKRTERERTEALKRGKEHIIERLVSLMDVMEQAEAAAKTAKDVKSVAVGLDLLYGEFKRLLREEGLDEVAANPGEKFDPSLHEALEMVPDEGDEGLVLGVVQKGYRFQGGLLRPARVKVSAKPAEKK